MDTFIPEYPLFTWNDIPQHPSKVIFVQKMLWILATLTFLMAVRCSLNAVQQNAAARFSDKELRFSPALACVCSLWTG